MMLRLRIALLAPLLLAGCSMNVPFEVVDLAEKIAIYTEKHHDGCLAIQEDPSLLEDEEFIKEHNEEGEALIRATRALHEMLKGGEERDGNDQ